MRRREIPWNARFVTFSCQGRLPLLSNPKIAGLFVRAVSGARARHGFLLYAWVVMPEHVHVLCRAPDGSTLESQLRRIKMSVAKRVLERWKQIDAPILKRVADATGRPRFWQKGGGFDRNVRDDEELCREIRYIHRNPVERGLVAAPELWRWSSVRWWMGRREGEVTCDPPPGRAENWAGWMGFM
jgi:putative transposase